ncbi:hypothetical protein D9M72_565730 [compost metagenome]
MPGASIVAPAVSGRITGRSSRRSISAASRPPGRSSRISSPSTLMIVDSKPISAGPASRISFSFSPRSASTWTALVGLILPEVLALGAASGRPKRAITRREKPSGMRMPSVSRPAEASACTLLSGRCGKISVRGPGQKVSARRREIGSKRTWASAIAMSETCEISGLKRGRPFIS